MTDFSESYANNLIRVMSRYSFERTPMVLCKMPLSVYSSGGIEKVLEFAIKWKADAIIGQFNEGDDLDLFRKNGIIVIAQDYRKRFNGISNITADYFAQGRDAAKYLIGLGVRNFGFYGLSGMVWSDERRIGFINTITTDIDAPIVSVLERSSMDEIWWYDLGRVTEWLRSLPTPVAILSCADNMAFHIIEACNQMSDPNIRIPEDVMLLGVDNDEPLCQLCSPTLSSLMPMIEQAGYYVAKQLDDRMKMPLKTRLDAISDVMVMPGSIVTRRSTDNLFHENPYIKNVCDYISLHYTENIKVDELVDLVPMSRRLLEKLFFKEMKVSIHQFIISLRIKRMIALMTQGHTPHEAADLMNMDSKALSRSFKSVMGMTPSDYIRQLSKE